MAVEPAIPAPVPEISITPGTAIARQGFAALICGPSGIGKSDLALRALTIPIQLPGEAAPSLFQLISDDQTNLRSNGTMLEASPPQAIKGLLEVRGIGIVSCPHISDLPLVLVANLTHSPIDRLPEQDAQQTMIHGTAISVVAINPFEASAPVKLALALARAAEQH